MAIEVINSSICFFEKIDRAYEFEYIISVEKVIRSWTEKLKTEKFNYISYFKVISSVLFGTLIRTKDVGNLSDFSVIWQPVCA